MTSPPPVRPDHAVRSHRRAAPRPVFEPPPMQRALSSAVQWNLDVLVVLAWLLGLVLLIIVTYGNALFS